MASVAQYEDRSPAIGRILSRAFGTIGANPLAVFGIAFLVSALPQASVTLAFLAIGQSDPGTAFVLTTVLGAVISLLLSLLTQGALTRVAVAHADGERTSFAQVVWAGLKVVLPLLALAIAMTLGIAAGFAVAVVPGIMLWVAWSVAAPAMVAEDRGVLEALGRSLALTRGARWKVFALELVVLVFYWLFAAVIGIGTILLAAIIGQHPGVIWWPAASVLISKTLTAGVSGTIQAALYVELRDWKDGPASRRLADIFA